MICPYGKNEEISKSLHRVSDKRLEDMTHKRLVLPCRHFLHDRKEKTIHESTQHNTRLRLRNQPVPFEEKPSGIDGRGLGDLGINFGLGGGDGSGYIGYIAGHLLRGGGDGKGMTSTFSSAHIASREYWYLSFRGIVGVV